MFHHFKNRFCSSMFSVLNFAAHFIRFRCPWLVILWFSFNMNFESCSPTRKRKRRILYNESWEKIPQFQNWLERSGNRDHARCRYCSVNFPIYYDGMEALKKHEKTTLHQRSIPSFSGPTPLEANGHQGLLSHLHPFRFNFAHCLLFKAKIVLGAC